ncbi:MAG TPA: type IX secretion system protein PorQ [Ohtaekwangia sp.]|uniref:type IX secretion system protein PorQ n=1 Tax=Ohtaekwangia sp. TaxID=2066019 RepID=UPI002F922306
MKRLLPAIWILLATPCFAQVGGQKSFDFLNVANNARLAALGGVNTSLTDRDLNFFFSNPSLVSDSLAGFASATYQFYVADVGQSTFSYAHKFNSIGTLAFGIQHIGYGTIQGYDASGNDIGTYKSGETALVIGKSHQIAHFRFGANVKMVFSNIAGYRASAAMLDLGGVFIHPEKDLRIGLTVKNLGIVFSEYSETSSTELPFDVQLGASFKPEHMPLRFSVTAYNLARKDVTYYNASSGQDKPGTLDKVLRRFNFGVEVLLHRNVNILAGYNYRVHQELKLDAAGGGAGLSLGFSARIRSFEFVFSRSGYVAGKAGYGLTLSSNINSMLRRR